MHQMVLFLMSELDGISAAVKSKNVSCQGDCGYQNLIWLFIFSTLFIVLRSYKKYEKNFCSAC